MMLLLWELAVLGCVLLLGWLKKGSKQLSSPSCSPPDLTLLLLKVESMLLLETWKMMIGSGICMILWRGLIGSEIKMPYTTWRRKPRKLLSNSKTMVWINYWRKFSRTVRLMYMFCYKVCLSAEPRMVKSINVLLVANHTTMAKEVKPTGKI